MCHNINIMARSAHSDIHVGPQGRVVIPARMRRELDISPGETLVAHVEDGRLVLEKPGQILARLQASFARIPPEVSLVDELIAERKREAQREASE